MKRITFHVLEAFAVCAVLSGTPASAVEMYTPEYRSCGEGGTSSIVGCVQEHAKAWDRRLNTAYAILMKNLTGTPRETMQAAQREWLAYRKANCQYYAVEPGSIQAIGAAECMRAMTQDRASELESDAKASKP